MTPQQAKAISVERLKPETRLIFMETPHSTNNVDIGTVPFVFTDCERAPVVYNVHWFSGQRLMKFNGRIYAVFGYGPTDSLKQRAIIGPYKP